MIYVPACNIKMLGLTISIISITNEMRKFSTLTDSHICSLFLLPFDLNNPRKR